MGYNNLKVYPSQSSLLVPLHQRSLQTDTCCVVVLSTATGTLWYSGMAFSMDRDTVRCTCCGTDFSVATDASQCTLLQSGLICGQRCFGMYVLPCGFIHKSLWLKFSLEFQPVQYRSTGTAVMPWPSASPGTCPQFLSKCSQVQQNKIIRSRACERSKSSH